MQNYLILIDDEELLLSTLERALKKRLPDGVPLRSTLSSVEASHWIRQEKPAALIVDAGISPVPSFKLVEILFQTWGPVPVMVITGQASSALVLAQERSRFVYMPKPFKMSEFSSSVINLLRSGPQIHTDAAYSFNLAERLMLCCLSACTGALSLGNSTKNAGLWFCQGRLFHARTVGLSGYAAFLSILETDWLSISFEDTKADEVTLHHETTELLAKAYQV